HAAACRRARAQPSRPADDCVHNATFAPVHVPRQGGSRSNDFGKSEKARGEIACDCEIPVKVLGENAIRWNQLPARAPAHAGLRRRAEKAICALKVTVASRAKNASTVARVNSPS